MAARKIATKPRILDNSKPVCEVKPDAATIAPTIITEEIALVTDIKGVCNEGVTLQTTKYPTNIDNTKILSLNINGSISTITTLY